MVNINFQVVVPEKIQDNRNIAFTLPGYSYVDLVWGAPFEH